MHKHLLFDSFGFRDSDDEAEGKNKMVEIVNEVVEEDKVQETKEMSAENKAAQALEKVFNQDDEETNLENENSVKSTNNSNYTSESLSSNSTSPPKNLEKHRKISKKPISPYIVSVDSHGDEYSPPPEENNSPSNTEEEKVCSFLLFEFGSELEFDLSRTQFEFFLNIFFFRRKIQLS